MKLQFEITPGKKLESKKNPVGRPEKHRRWLMLAAEAFVFVVIVILFVEGFLKTSGAGQQQFLKPDSVLGCVHIPDKKIVWRMEGYSDDRLNSLGYRDVEHKVGKPDHIVRVALLGDSMTEGIQVPLESTFARQLEVLLNKDGNRRFEVLNFACSSYSTGQEYLQFSKEVKKYKPDVTVLLYGRGDSLENSRDPKKSRCEPRPYFYLDAGGNLQVDNLILMARYPQGFDKTIPGRIDTFARSHSAIYGVLSQADLSLSIQERFYRKLRSLASKAAQLVSGTGDEKHMVAQYGMPNAWNVTESIIKHLNKDCADAGSSLVIMVSPNTVGDVQLGWQAAQMELLGRKEGFGVLDLTPAFNKHSDVNSLFYDVHFTRDGHALTARELKGFLHEHRLAGML